MLKRAGREAVKWCAEQILRLDEQLAEIESALHEKCREIPYAENILAINGVGENTGGNGRHQQV